MENSGDMLGVRQLALLLMRICSVIDKTSAALILYRNGSEVFRDSPETIDLSGSKDFKRIKIQKELALDSTLQPGDYVLQLPVRDKQEKRSIA